MEYSSDYGLDSDSESNGSPKQSWLKSYIVELLDSLVFPISALERRSRISDLEKTEAKLVARAKLVANDEFVANHEYFFEKIFRSKSKKQFDAIHQEAGKYPSALHTYFNAGSWLVHRVAELPSRAAGIGFEIFRALFRFTKLVLPKIQKSTDSVYKGMTAFLRKKQEGQVLLDLALTLKAMFVREDEALWYDYLRPIYEILALVFAFACFVASYVMAFVAQVMRYVGTAIYVPLMLVLLLPIYAARAASWMWNNKSYTLESLLLGAVAAGWAFIAFGMAPVLMAVAGVVGFITALVMFNLPVDSKTGTGYSKYTPWVQPGGWEAMGRYALLAIALLLTFFGALMVASSMPAFGSVALFGISLSAATSAATPVLAGLGLALAPQILIVVGIALVASSLMMVVLPNVMDSILGCFKGSKVPQGNNNPIPPITQTQQSLKDPHLLSKITGCVQWVMCFGRDESEETFRGEETDDGRVLCQL